MHAHERKKFKKRLTPFSSTEQAAATSLSKQHARQVLKIRLGCLALILFVAVGIWANYPYLEAEHRRWNFWQLIGLWFSDIAATFWFARFAFVHAIQGVPLVPQPVRGTKRFKWMAIGIFAAILIDLVFTLYLMRVEKVEYAHGQATVAQIISIDTHKRALATGYDLECGFLDAGGAPHQAHFRVLAEKNVMPATLPQEAAHFIQNGEHGQIRIRYDRTLPERAWIDGLGWQDDNGIYWISLGNLCLQAVSSLIFLLLLTKHSATGISPWWSDIYKVLPLAAETFCMFAMGMIDRLMDSLQ